MKAWIMAYGKMGIGKPYRNLDMNDPDQTPPLLLAIEKSDRKTLRHYLENGGDPDFEPRTGRSLMDHAIENEAHWAVKLLVKHNVSLEKQNYDGYTPLVCCVRVGSKSATTLAILLKAGADPNGASAYGVMPLSEAVMICDEKKVNLLMNSGANLKDAWKGGKSPWSDAGSEQGFNLLLRLGINPMYSGQSNKNALHYASICGLPGIVKKLIKTYKTDVNSQDLQGKTPLMFAVISGNVKVCKVLLENGANIHLLDDTGRSAANMVHPRNHGDDASYGALNQMMVIAARKALGKHINPVKRKPATKTRKVKF